MRIYCKTLRLSACLFALLCLSSAGYASPPSTDVHFCQVLDFEDMRVRDSIYAATKHALDLNVGEPRTVRMIYFLPNDRPFRQEVVDSMKVTIRQIQTFYAEQMQAHGYGDRTFRFETDAQGEPLVHRVDGQHPDSHYFNTVSTVFNEIRQVFDPNANIYFIVVDNGTNSIGQGGQRVAGVGGRRGKNSGDTLFPSEFSFKTAAHELGHAFGLRHDFNNNTYMMSYGTRRDRLSMCNAEFLAVHPYFNPNTSIEETQSPTIELLSPQEYSTGSKSISIQLKVSDSDGLHQVLLFVTTGEPHRAAGFREVKACRGLAGEKDAVVEFEYDGVIPSAGGTSLSNSSVHTIYFSVVDIDGNVNDTFFPITEVSAHHIATLAGHTSEVTSLAFSPDGQILASGEGNGIIRLWDLATLRYGSLISSLAISLAFSPDGQMLASGSLDEINLWNVASGENIATFKGHIGIVNSVAFSPDGQTLASGTSDNIVRLWDIIKKENIATFEGHTNTVYSVSFSPDGQTLASGSRDQTIRLWDILTGANFATLEGHRGWVYSVSFSPDGQTLASGSRDQTIRLWDILTGANFATLEGHTDVVSSVTFSPDGITLASGSYDYTVRLWDILTGANFATFAGHTNLVHSVSFSPDGTMLASGSIDNMIRLWDTSESTQPRPRMLVKISGDNQQGMPGAELAMPLVVEVRDQYGNPLQGAQVAFTVTSGGGKLSGRFTTENTITDANGRAQSMLIPGPETNTVEASVPGIEVTFSATGIGTPTTPVVGGDYPTWHLPDGAIARLGKGIIGERDRAIAFSSDSQHFAVASGIGVWLYDVATSRELALLTGHESGVRSVAFSPDNRTLASGAMDATIRLWNVVSGEHIATFEGHRSWVNSVSFSSDGTMLASGGDTVRLWDVATGENIFTLEGHTGQVNSVSFSPDGTILASGSADQTVKLWNIATEENIFTLEGHTGQVNSVSFSPDGTILASGARDKTIRLWDVKTGTNTAILRHRSIVFSVSFSPDGKTLASTSYGEVKLWDIEAKTDIATFVHTHWVRSVAFSPNGSTLAAGAGDGLINLWDVETKNFVTLRHTRGVESVAFSPDGTTLAAGVNLWDVATGRNVTTLERYVGPVTFSPDGTTLASGTGWKVRLWDVSTGKDTAVLEGHDDIVNSVSYSPDGTTLVSGSYDYTVKLWDIKTKETIVTLGGHTDGVLSVAYSPDETTLASAGGYSDKTVKLWDIETKETIATLEGHTNAVTSVAYAPDGKTLVSGSADKTIRLWDVATREIIAIFEGHADWVTSVVFSPDGITLASGSYDKTVKLWDVATGRLIATFEGHRGLVYSATFLPYGTTLASGSADGTVLLWDMSDYITPVVYIPDANLQVVIRSALGKSRFSPITTTDMASLTALDASNRNIRELDGLEFATNLTELNLVDNRLSSLSINTHIPALQDRGVEVLFDKTPTPDFDGDGAVGFADFLLFVAQFGFSEDDEGYDVWFDLNGDGMIGFGDFLIFANAFGKAVSSN